MTDDSLRARLRKKLGDEIPASMNCDAYARAVKEALREMERDSDHMRARRSAARAIVEAKFPQLSEAERERLVDAKVAEAEV